MVIPSTWEVLDARDPTAAATPPVSVRSDPLPSPSPARLPPVDLRGARVSAAAACRQLSSLAAPEPGGDASALPGLCPASPAGGAGAASLAGPRPTDLGLTPHSGKPGPLGREESRPCLGDYKGGRRSPFACPVVAGRVHDRIPAWVGGRGGMRKTIARIIPSGARNGAGCSPTPTCARM